MSSHVLVLGENRKWPLKWSLLARSRLQSLPRVATFEDLSGERNVFACLQFGWAMLPRSAPFATPDDLAEELDKLPDGLDRLDDALAAALLIAFPQHPNQAAAKKTSTDSSHAPA